MEGGLTRNISVLPNIKKSDTNSTGQRKNIKIDDLLDPHQLLLLENVFSKHPKGELSEEDFIKSFKDVLGQNMIEEDLRTWFMRIDANANGSVDWDEFSSHLLYHNHGVTENGRIKEYIPSSHQLENRHARCHKQHVSKILIHERANTYWTSSHDGMVIVWNPNTLRHSHCINNNTAHLWSSSSSPNTVMITDICLSPSSASMYVAAANRTINVYDMRYAHIKRYVGRKIYNEVKESAGMTGTMAQGSIAKIRDAESKAKLEKGIVATQYHPKVDTTALLQMEDPPSSLEVVQIAEREHLITGLNNGQLIIYSPGRGTIVRSLPPVQKLQTHSSLITNTRYLPQLGGFTLLTSSWDKTLKLTDLEVGVCTHILGNETSRHSVCCIDYNPNAKLIVSSGPEREISLWNPFISQPLALLSGHLTPIVGIAFNPQDNQVISMSADKCVKIWDLRTLKLFQSFADDGLGGEVAISSHGCDKTFTAMAFDNRNQRIVAASTRVQAWPIRRSIPNFAAEYRGHADQIAALLIANMFDQVLTCDVGGCVQLWNLSTGEPEFLFNIKTQEDARCHNDTPFAPTCACLDIFERRFIVGDNRGRVHIFNYSNGQDIRCCRPQRSKKKSKFRAERESRISDVVHIAKTDGSYRYVVASCGVYLYVFNDCESTGVGPAAAFTSEKDTLTIECQHGIISSIIACSHNPLATVGTLDGEIIVYNVSSACEIAVYSKEKSTISESLSAATRLPSLRGAEQRTSRQVFFLTEPSDCDVNNNNKCNDSLSSDSSSSCDISSDSDSDNEHICSLLGFSSVDQKKGIRNMCSIPERQLLATISVGIRIDFWNVKKQRHVMRYGLQYDNIGTFVEICVDPKSDYLAASDNTGIVVVFNISLLNPPECSDMNEESLFRAHDSTVIAISIVTNGFVITCGADLYIKLHSCKGVPVGCFGQSFKGVTPWNLKDPSTWKSNSTVSQYHLPIKRTGSMVKSRKNRRRERSENRHQRELTRQQQQSSEASSFQEKNVQMDTKIEKIDNTISRIPPIPVAASPTFSKKKHWFKQSPNIFIPGKRYKLLPVGCPKKLPLLRNQQSEHDQRKPELLRAKTLRAMRKQMKISKLPSVIKSTALCCQNSQRKAAMREIKNIKVSTPGDSADDTSSPVSMSGLETNKEPLSPEIISERVKELLSNQSSQSRSQHVSDISKAVLYQREVHPKEWVERAVSLLPLKGKSDFYSVTHPTASWSTTIQQIASRKRNTKSQRHQPII